MAQLPAGIRFLVSFSRDQWYRAFIFVLTFLLYASFHLSRKPISIVKGELHKYCEASSEGDVRLSSPSRQSGPVPPQPGADNETHCGWAPFDKDNYQQLLGALDYSFLCTYAVGMYLSGIIGERLPIRYYLTSGMLASGAFTALFGLGYFYDIHSFGFYVVAQTVGLGTGLRLPRAWPALSQKAPLLSSAPSGMAPYSSPSSVPPAGGIETPGPSWSLCLNGDEFEMFYSDRFEPSVGGPWGCGKGRRSGCGVQGCGHQWGEGTSQMVPGGRDSLKTVCATILALYLGLALPEAAGICPSLPIALKATMPSSEALQTVPGSV